MLIRLVVGETDLLKKACQVLIKKNHAVNQKKQVLMLLCKTTRADYTCHHARETRRRYPLEHACVGEETLNQLQVRVSTLARLWSRAALKKYVQSKQRSKL